MTVTLRADCVKKAYGHHSVLTSATLRAAAGEITYLLGRNGCGKSTLLRIAAGELPPDSGVVFYKGRASLRQRWHRLARDGFAYLPDRELLSPRRTVRQHLDTVVRQYRLAGHREIVERCELAPLLDVRCGDLSSGERRRAELATVLVRRPDCLLADEPYRNVDPVDRQIIASAIRELAGQGCAVVITGHEVEDLMQSVDSVVWCTDGTTYEMGTPEAALANSRLVQSYVGEVRAERMLAELSTTPEGGLH